jgi:hypothetical protein
MFSEKAGLGSRFFTKHPKDFAAAGSKKELLRSPGY